MGCGRNGSAVSYALAVGLALAGSVAAEAEDARPFAAYREFGPFRAPAEPVREAVPGFLWIEAEAFADYGGWSLDTQFTHKMGSAYLIAAGVCKPLAAARTTIDVPRAGTWCAWVRTKDWLPEFSPGCFTVSVGGRDGATLGASAREGWRWERAGEFTLAAGRVEIALKDLAGAFARCDAILLTTDLAYAPPTDEAELLAERRRLRGESAGIADGGAFDLVVVGAGPGGMGTAIAAARCGIRVALVHDRSVLGGNASAEHGVGMQGATGWYGGPRETGIVGEASLRRFPEKGRRLTYSHVFREMADELKDRLVEFPNERVLRVEKRGEEIAAAIARSTLTGRETRFRGRLFADCTGDGWLGCFAGAKFMRGREARAEFDEKPAPERRDDFLMSGCLMDNCLGYRYAFADKPVKYETPAWAQVLPGGFTRRVNRLDSEWWVEHSARFDELADPERARDELVRISFAYWGWIKNASKLREKAANAYLTSMPYKNARREGMRLEGDCIFTANDALAGRLFPDRVAYGGWPLDTHDPRGIEARKSDGYWKPHPFVPTYSVPFRSLYSKNVPNLLMAGRCVSATHIALGSLRVQATLCEIGQAVGTAAALMLPKGLLPREYGQRHIVELQQRLLKDDAYVPRLANADPDDRARSAAVCDEAGGRIRTLAPTDAEVCGANPVWHAMDRHRRAVCFARRNLDRLDAISLRLKSTRSDAVAVTAEVFMVSSSAELPQGKPFGRLVGEVSAKGAELVRFRPLGGGLPLAASHVWIALPSVPGLAWALRDGQLDPGESRIYQEGRRWKCAPGQYAFVTEPALEWRYDSGAEKVIDGVARAEDGDYHGWRSDPHLQLPQSVRLDFPRPTDIGEVRLTFDPELFACNQADRPPELVKAYRIEGRIDGTWRLLAQEANNHLRHRIHRFDRLQFEAIRVFVDETWGDPSARIFEIRCYP